MLDEMGHGEHGSRRLGAAMRALKADRAGSLRPMLKGLDVVELLSLPPPDTSYRVVYEAEDSDSVALRQELGGLRLMALQKRAIHAGISDADLETAMDSSDPKASLIKLVLEHHTSAASAADAARQALRSELNGLRLMALRGRAAAAGVADRDLEDAVDSDDRRLCSINTRFTNTRRSRTRTWTAGIADIRAGQDGSGARYAAPDGATQAREGSRGGG